MIAVPAQPPIQVILKKQLFFAFLVVNIPHTLRCVQQSLIHNRSLSLCMYFGIFRTHVTLAW